MAARARAISNTTAAHLDNCRLPRTLSRLLAEGKPEERRYKAIYVLNDAENGQFNNELTVTCQP